MSSAANFPTSYWFPELDQWFESYIENTVWTFANKQPGRQEDVLRFLEDEAKARQVQRIFLHAQTYVVPFYRQHGYREEGVTFQEAGIEHILMRKALA